MAKFYIVGGYVRDKLMGVKSKDIDYSVEAESYGAMRQAVLDRGCKIFVEKEEFLTIRARDPRLGAVDFVLCRKDGEYQDGRRPERVEVGSLHDDLARRDFTVNAIAMDDNGNIIDPFNGREDLGDQVIRCVGDPHKRFSEDYLRILRAIRFSVTKRFSIEQETSLAIHSLKERVADVAVERIREELLKAFAADTVKTLNVLQHYSLLGRLFDGDLGLKLMPTLKSLS